MQQTRYISIVPFIIVLVLLTPIIFIPKDQSLLFINGFHSPGRDLFFKNLTWLGEGFMVCCCVLVLLFLKVRWFFVFVIGLIIHVLLIQINKQYLFNDVYRPSIYMQWIGKDHLLHFAEGIKIRREVSFPSGHTTGATFTSSFIALVIRQRRASWILAILAISIGFSRVYLAQHFVVDIYFGFLFGTISSIIGYKIIQNIQSHYRWMNNYLIVIKSKRIRTGFEILKQSFIKSLKSSPKY